MDPSQSHFRDVQASLADLLGDGFVESACRSRSALTGESLSLLSDYGFERLSILPQDYYDGLTSCLANVGTRVCDPFSGSSPGAGTRAFAESCSPGRAPLATNGWFRVSEDGVLRCTTKAEHYHLSLGHGIPGMELLENARRLGIDNATHNNTRGHITRTVEVELVRAANGLSAGDTEELTAVLGSREPRVLNRVLNLQTGSLACEAALKLALARFHRHQAEDPAPPCAGRTPVVIVIGDDDGGLCGNYHGTSVTGQILRGLWPGMRERLEQAGIMAVRAVKPNDLAGLRAAFACAGQAPLQVAAFIHEIVMMNYGARLLDPEFLSEAYRLCREHDAPAIVDEIQSCAWCPDIFMFREYGLSPNMLVLGKGMSSGVCSASKLLLDGSVDLLPQFGALVTNGQEELASLTYLITLAWLRSNGDAVAEAGRHLESRIRDLGRQHGELVQAVNGKGHLMGIAFRQLEMATSFCRNLTTAGLDISTQTYKADCPPVALLKPPVTFGHEPVEFVVGTMDRALVELSGG